MMFKRNDAIHKSYLLSDEKKPYFDKEITLVIKGIALILMFVHHFFTFPAWWCEGIEYPLLKEIAPYFCEPLKLCVPIFCFLSGYFYFYNKDKSYLYSARKITDVLINYWCVFFLFSGIAVMLGHYVYTPDGYIGEMFALKRPTMSFCWYVSFYYSFMLILPLIARLLSKNIYLDLFISIFLFSLFRSIIESIVLNYFGNTIIKELLNNLTWFPTVLVGYVFAKYQLFNKAACYYSKVISFKKGIFLWIVIALFVPMGRYVFPFFSLELGSLPMIPKSISFRMSMDLLYTPVFIFCVASLCGTVKLKYTQLILKQIGKYSLLMWFVSCIFYNNSKKVFQPILYWPHNPVLVLIWGLLICYIASVILNLGISIIIKQKNKIIFHKI